ncbi:hypothetical protein PV328_004689 [Microctonus aethiopoides]|uniref:J domain-containing protein n=1 Tax=Microctonus aethiopoides TaxID=144406 RepID=A0AA39FB16_9HYME|nr:hypothetical protein PV328_004689 [Microctonus aethiopoides]
MCIKVKQPVSAHSVKTINHIEYYSLNKIMFPCGLIFVLLNLLLDVGGTISQGEIAKHLELGWNFLARGQLQDALTQYHAAVDGDPNNYLTYYKRGIVYLALERPKLALSDFNKVLELKPDFTSARLQRAQLLLKQALFDQALQDFNDVLAVEPNNQEALSGMYSIEPTQNEMYKAKAFAQQGAYVEAIQLITNIIEICPWASELREIRAECHVALGDYMNAVSDMQSTTKLLTDNTRGFYKLSVFRYRLGHVDKALAEIRNCLKLDPEHKECFPFYKKIKKIAKYLNDATAAEESRQFPDCIESAQRVLKSEPTVDNVRFSAYQILCKCYTNNNEPSLAVKHCQDGLKIHRHSDLLCDSAEAYLAAEMYDDAIREVKEALEIDPHFPRAKELLQTAHQRQKMSESRDYYKILGIPRSASKREVIKAYRKAAQKWHPDNFPDTDEKKLAQKKFIDIAAAKEVLTDEEKRAKFDRGEDPLDPESGKHQQGFNPFHEFQHFQGGSPFQFKFHFN